MGMLHPTTWARWVDLALSRPWLHRGLCDSTRRQSRTNREMSPVRRRKPYRQPHRARGRYEPCSAPHQGRREQLTARTRSRGPRRSAMDRKPCTA
eukprot:128337-Pleurochrysis_carterae.AAC.1